LIFYWYSIFMKNKCPGVTGTGIGVFFDIPAGHQSIKNLWFIFRIPLEATAHDSVNIHSFQCGFSACCIKFRCVYQCSHLPVTVIFSVNFTVLIGNIAGFLIKNNLKQYQYSDLLQGLRLPLPPSPCSRHWDYPQKRPMFQEGPVWFGGGKGGAGSQSGDGGGGHLQFPAFVFCCGHEISARVRCPLYLYPKVDSKAGRIWHDGQEPQGPCRSRGQSETSFCESFQWLQGQSLHVDQGGPRISELRWVPGTGIVPSTNLMLTSVQLQTKMQP